jgi:hypothetical protein
VCGKIEYAQKYEDSPMHEIILPMKYYDETGRQHGLTRQEVDICSECFKVLEGELSKHYDMCRIAYGGYEIKRRPTEKGGEQG